jgi:hypothetical protein
MFAGAVAWRRPTDDKYPGVESEACRGVGIGCDSQVVLVICQTSGAPYPFDLNRTEKTEHSGVDSSDNLHIDLTLTEQIIGCHSQILTVPF